jgi:hypothetical protein
MPPPARACPDRAVGGLLGGLELGDDPGEPLRQRVAATNEQPTAPAICHGQRSSVRE